ncbi:MAG TPA: hypothetical protein VGM24_01915, partial [Puia sp.]
DNFGSGSVTDQSFSWRINNFFNHFFYSEQVLFLPGLAGYFFIKKRNDLFLIWSICEFIGISLLGIFSQQHFKNLLAPLSLMTALSIERLLEIYSIPARQTMIVVLICFFPKIWEPIGSFKNLFRSPEKTISPDSPSMNNQEDDYSKKLLGLWIRSNTDPGSRVLIAGFAAIAQAYSERVSASIYFNVTQTQLAKNIFYQDIKRNAPGMICVPTFPTYFQNVNADIRDSIDQLVSRKYILRDHRYGYNIFLKNEQPKWSFHKIINRMQ